MNDPILLALVAIVVVLAILFFVSLISLYKRESRQKALYKRAYLRSRAKDPGEKTCVKDLIENLVGFALAYRERAYAKGGNIPEADQKMQVLWDELPAEFQEKLLSLGMRANLTVQAS